MIKKITAIFIIIISLGFLVSCGEKYTEVSKGKYGEVIEFINNSINNYNKKDRINVNEKITGSKTVDREYNFFRDLGLSEIHVGSIHRFRSSDYIYIYDEDINSYKIRKDANEVDEYHEPKGGGSYYWYSINQLIDLKIEEIVLDEVNLIESNIGFNKKEYRIWFKEETINNQLDVEYETVLGFTLSKDDLITYNINEIKKDSERDEENIINSTEYIISKNKDIEFVLPDNYTDFYGVQNESEVFNPIKFEFIYKYNLVFTNWSMWVQNYNYVDEENLYITTNTNLYIYNYKTFEMVADRGLPFNSKVVSTTDDYIYLLAERAILRVSKLTYDIEVFYIPSAFAVTGSKNKIMFFKKSDKNILYQLDVASNDVKQVYTFSNSIFSIIYNDKLDIYYVVDDKSLYAYNPINSNIVFEIKKTTDVDDVKYEDGYIYFDQKKYGESGQFISEHILPPRDSINGEVIEGMSTEIKIKGTPYRTYDSLSNKEIEYETEMIGGFHSNIKSYKNYFYTSMNGLCQIDPYTREYKILSKNYWYYDKLVFNDDRIIWINKARDLYIYNLNTNTLETRVLPSPTDANYSYGMYVIGIDGDDLYYAYENKNASYHINKYSLKNKTTVDYYKNISSYGDYPMIANGYMYYTNWSTLYIYDLYTKGLVKTIKETDTYSLALLPNYLKNGYFYFDYEGNVIGEFPKKINYISVYDSNDNYIVTEAGLYNTKEHRYNIHFKGEVDSAAIVDGVVAVIDYSHIDFYYYK